MAKSAIVIGGGIGGLATAALLAKSGMKVQLFEGRDAVGGRASLWEQDGFKFDMGPSWYLMPDAFEQFFKLMGTTAANELELVRLDPAYQTRNEGYGDKLVIRESVGDNKALFEAVQAGAGEGLQRYLDSAEDTYKLAVDHFLYTNFTNLKPFTHPAVLKRLGNFAKHLLSSLDDFASKHVSEPRLKKILDFPAVFLGASPYSTPSMYHLMTHVDMNVGVFYPMGGFYTIIEAIERLARQHGVEIHVNSPVTKILVDEAGTARGVQIGEAVVAADIVVANADLHHVETKLLEPKHQTLPQKWWDKRDPAPSGMLLYLGVKGELPQLDHHTLLYTKDWAKNFKQVFKKADGKSIVPNPASLYICKPSATDPSVAPEGFENVFVLVPIAADPSIGRGGINRSGDAEFEAEADRIIEQIAEWCEIPDLAERIVLRRTMGPKNFADELNAWSGTALGMAHTLRQSAFFRPKNVSSKVKGLYFVGHNAVPGIGLPMCLIGAELVYKRLTNDGSAGPIQHELRPLADSEWKGLR
jgi:1-hydroxy-2-isopentenylcarotenoid 3,4-desaturase